MESIKSSIENLEKKGIDEGGKTITLLPPVKQIAIFLIGFIGIYIITFVVEIIASLGYAAINGIDALKGLDKNYLFLIIIQTITYLLTLLAILLTINVDIKKLFIKFKSPLCFAMGIVFAVAIIVFENMYSLIFDALGHPLELGGNQEEIEKMAAASVVISILTFGIIGPVTEELTYRVGLYSFLRRKNKILAYLVTSLLFGSIHIILQLGTNFLNELLLLPIYAGSGFLLTLAYEKFGFAGSLTAHIAVNLISLI